jgi:hypothetical protein
VVLQVSAFAVPQVEESAVQEEEPEHGFDFPFFPPLLYPSAHQPPPLSWNELKEMSFLNCPEQEGQVFNGVSERCCNASITWEQDSHWYS